MDRLDKWHVRAEAWLNRKVFRMTDETNKKTLINTFSGYYSSVDRKFQEYIITLFPS